MDRATGRWKRQPVDRKARTTLARQRNEDVSHEVLGASYEFVMSEGRHAGDPIKRPQGVPAAWAHPQRLGPDVLQPGGPRILPVSQEVEHRPEQSREEAFWAWALRQDGATLAEFYGDLGFRDRRVSGRRYRGTENVDELFAPQESNRVKGWQRDLPLSRYLQY
jgi:hypothetical protein